MSIGTNFGGGVEDALAEESAGKSGVEEGEWKAE